MKYLSAGCMILIVLCCFSACKIKTQDVKERHELWPEIMDIGHKNEPKSITRTIIRDQNGNVWFATWDGIIKYDGDAFTNITKKVSLNRFFSILEDKKGNIWMGSLGSGVYYFDGTSFINYTVEDGLANDRVTYIYEDRIGNVWFATEGGVSCYDGKSFKNFTTENGLPDNDVNTILEDRNGNFWIGTRSNAYKYDGKTFELIRMNGGHPFKNVRHIIADINGNIWLGGGDGLWHYDYFHFRNYSENFVGYIYEDKVGNIWTSAENENAGGWALTRYDVSTLNNDKVVATQIKLEEGMYFGITEDLDGNIWFGTLNGVYRYDGVTFENFQAQQDN